MYRNVYNNIHKYTTLYKHIYFKSRIPLLSARRRAKVVYFIEPVKALPSDAVQGPVFAMVMYS